MKKKRIFVCLVFGLLFSLFNVQWAMSSLTPTLSWNAPVVDAEHDAATGFVLDYGTTSGGPYDVTIDVGNSFSYTIPMALDPSTDWYFVLTPYNPDDDGPTTGELHFSTRDVDGDGLLDGDEIFLYGTNPNLADSDDDGIDDDVELTFWGDDWDADLDGDGIINILDPDSDGDYFADGVDLEPDVAANTHAVFISVIGEGTATPTGTAVVYDGDDLTINFTPASGNHILSVEVNSESEPATSPLFLTNITANMTVVVEYTANVYTLTATAGTGGTISPNYSGVMYGGSVTYDIEPDFGYLLSSLTDNGISVIDQVANNQYAVSNVSADHTILANFAKIPTYPVYRFANLTNGAYLFTANETEKNYIISSLASTWRYEGIKFYAYKQSWAETYPVYRFANLTNGAYLFTINETEKNYIISSLASTWRYEGVKFYAYKQNWAGTRPIYRFANLINGAYLLTASETEKNYIISSLASTWRYEGAVFYGF